MKSSKVKAEPCKFVKEDGTACKGYSVKGTGYCIAHAKKLGVYPASQESIDEFIVEANPVVKVEEPEAVKVLRASLKQLEVGGGIDPAVGVQLANILRPYFGLTPMDGIELAGQIDRRQQADEEIARSFQAKQALIERSNSLIIEHPDPVRADQMKAKVARDLSQAATNFRLKTDAMKRKLLSENKVVINGTGEVETYSVNGVKIVIPAEGQYEVPETIAQLHRNRLRTRAEKMARSGLMMKTPEYREVQKGMAEIDQRFGTSSQLGGGPAAEEDDFLVAEEIK